ncbi:GNAT family N-acetyltransferase [Altericista sp. CCNU0014]|uniref:GNAT family N-acetyltransferase n=1 Tax=Altericista sp. CCNU0014 TaxID=3082949 RepID=UPI0038511325
MRDPDRRPFLEGQPYRLRVGQRSDGKLLLEFMDRAYRELRPGAELSHLAETVRQLWSDGTRLWFVESALPESLGQSLGCLWLGQAVDQVSGDRYTHVFLLYVNPVHRRRGLGAALMKRAEAWAIQQNNSQLGLYVFVDNLPAQTLYRRLGYSPQATFLQKRLSPPP